MGFLSRAVLNDEVGTSALKRGRHWWWCSVKPNDCTAISPLDLPSIVLTIISSWIIQLILLGPINNELMSCREKGLNVLSTQLEKKIYGIHLDGECRWQLLGLSRASSLICFLSGVLNRLELHGLLWHFALLFFGSISLFLFSICCLTRPYTDIPHT